MVHIFCRSSATGRRWLARAALGCTLAGALALAGCASVPPPDASMNLAQNQLQLARDAGAADYAPVDLGFAQDKFQAAQTAMAERKYADAAALSQESRADAELATAKARLGAARARIDRQIHENDRLRARGEAAEQAFRQQIAAPSSPPSPAPGTLPTEDMPAPASSTLSTPPAGAGFQTIPANSMPTSDGQGGQP
jgi:hypothetical protein